MSSQGRTLMLTAVLTHWPGASISPWQTCSLPHSNPKAFLRCTDSQIKASMSRSGVDLGRRQEYVGWKEDVGSALSLGIKLDLSFLWAQHELEQTPV